MPNQDGVELRWIFAVMRRWWWVIAICALLTTVLGITITSFSKPVYDATATLLIQPAQDARSNEVNLLAAGERLALTYSQMIKSQPVVERVVEQEGLEMTPNQLSGKISSAPVADTQLMRLTVRDSSPEQAAYLANAISQEFTAFIKDMNLERYQTTLDSMQAKLDEIDASVQEMQSTMNNYRASMIESQADLTHQENNLREYRTEYQTLQSDYQDLQLTVSQLKEKVNVIEAAHTTDSTRSLYTATVTLFLTEEALAPTYIRILTGQPVLEETIALLGLSESPAELLNWISVESVSGTNLIQLNVSDVSEPQAILIADTLAWVFIDQVQKLVVEPYANNLNSLKTQLDEKSAQIDRTQLDIERLTLETIESETELVRLEGEITENRNDYRTLQQDYETLRLTSSDEAETVILSELAQAPRNPVQRGRLYILIAMGIGLMTGIGLAFFFEYLDDTIKTPQDVSESLGLSTVGSIPLINNGEDELIVIEQPRSPIAESYRMLATNVRFSIQDKSLGIILVTSPEPREGKSVTVANLGAAIAMLGTKVIIVDADLRRPRQQSLFSLKPGDGLTDVLLNGLGENTLQNTRIDNLSVLTSGRKTPPNPADLLSSHTMADLLDQLSKLADLVIIDSPPVLNIADTAALASSVDGVFIVIESGISKEAAAQQAIVNLNNVGAKIIGVVLNSVPKSSFSSYYYYEEELGSEENLVGERKKVRFQENFLSRRGRFQSQGIVPAIRGWFQSRR